MGRTARWGATVVLVAAIVVPMAAFAAGLPSKIVPCNGTDCTVCNIATLAQNIVNTAIFIAVFLSAILFAWAGVRFLTNRANPGVISAAKQIFYNVMIGLILILAAWLLIDTIMAAFTGNHLWNQLC